MTLEGSNQPVMKSVPVERSMPSSKIASEIEAPTAPYSEDTIRQIIVDLIEEATGYPRDMIGLDKSLDRDLRIDSIKRKELLAQVQKKLGLSPITDDAFWEDESVNSLSKKLFKLITG
jgi:acyl carrier protein